MKDKLSKATGIELSKLLGEIFYPDGHNWDLKNVMGRKECTRCGAVTNPLYSPDTPTCLIPLTWDESMKWRDWCVAEYGVKNYADELWKLWESVLNDAIEFEDWLACHIQPRDYLQAAAELKEKQK